MVKEEGEGGGSNSGERISQEKRGRAMLARQMEWTRRTLPFHKNFRVEQDLTRAREVEGGPHLGKM